VELLILLTLNAVQNSELVWMDILCKIIDSMLWQLGFSGVAPGRSRTVRLVGADSPGLWRGQSGPEERTVRTLAEQFSPTHFYGGD
jgi:hypothetical protein